MKKNKKVIVFEGIDGVGKSTQARLLYFALKKKGKSVELYHFPSDGVIGSFIRGMLKNGKFDLLDNKSRALLTTADFYDKFSDDKNESDIIIFDRYIYSSFVSNYNLDKEWINVLHRYAPNPDIVFFMNCNAETVIKRTDIDFGAKNLLRQRKFHKRYVDVFKNIEKFEIDASKELEEIHVKIIEEIKNKLKI